jgi:hypothetical protein
MPCTETAGAAGPPDGGDGAGSDNPPYYNVCNASGGGGGSSALLSVSRATATLTGNAGDSRLLVAGGGGGAGSFYAIDNSNGGSAGVATVTGAGSGGCNGGDGGEGGVGSGGGAAGCDGGNNGTATAGGAGSGIEDSSSGGGGGGWIGGGTDTRGAGGGAGSSYGGAGSGTVSVSTASATQEPEVVISWLVGPSVSTQASGSVTVGGSISDTATVSGGYSPTGTVTFNLYSNSAGSGTPLVTDANVPLQNGSATSTGYTTTHTGTDYWVATYNGDSNNSSESSGASSEPVSIGKASPSITTTQQPSSAVVGSTVADQATVSGSVDPSSGDTVTFDLYNSATTQNASTLLYSSTVPLGSGGTATSGSYTTKSTGTDYWVATFNGDANNGSVSSTAGGEPVTVMTASKLADLSVQIGGPASAADGTSFNETVTVHNAGPATAGYVLSALVVPAGVSVTSTGGGSEVLGVVYWTAAQINANSTVTYTLTFKVAAKVQGTVLIPAATVSLQNPDPNYANNVASTTIRLGSSGMQANIVRHLQNPIPAGKGLAAYLLRLTHLHHAERRPDHRSRSEVVRAPARRHSARQRWRAARHAG